MRVRTPDGISLHVDADDLGAGGPPFLLVHGLASNARMWDGVRDALAARGSSVAAVDLRGHGRSDKPDSGYDFETIAADLVAVLDALGWARAVVAGQSWGGNVAVEVAHLHPDRVEAIVCVDGGWIELSRTGPWEVVAERLAPPRLAGTPASEVEAWYRSTHPTWSETAIAGAMANFEVREDGTIAPHLTFERHMAILRHLWEHQPSRVFPLLRTPVVLVPCDDGTARVAETREAVARAEALLPSVRTVWFEASHDVHSERPDDIAAVLLEAAA